MLQWRESVDSVDRAHCTHVSSFSVRPGFYQLFLVFDFNLASEVKVS